MRSNRIQAQDTRERRASGGERKRQAARERERQLPSPSVSQHTSQRRVPSNCFSHVLRECLRSARGVPVPVGTVGRVRGKEDKRTFGELGCAVRPVRNMERQEGVEAHARRGSWKAQFTPSKVRQDLALRIML